MRSGMLADRLLGWILTASLFVVPWVVAPGLSFHFDVTPKAAGVLLLAAAAVPCIALRSGRLRAVWSDPTGRLFMAGLLLAAVAATLSTAFSERPALSFGGTNWRAMGLPVRLALLALAATVAAYASGSEERRRRLMSVGAAASLPVSGYAVLQYFGVDPLLPPIYYAGEQEWAVVRPPATLGHAGYLGVYLCAVLFWGARSGKWGRLAAAAAGVAILFSGSRGALVGLAAGAAVWAWRRRPALSSRVVLGTAAAAVCLAGFVLSPAGVRTRTRIQWSIEDFHGGSRPWLWRDALAMGAARPVAGHGIETFTSSYPQYKSVELAGMYPDQYQESPHNPLLGAWAEQGLLGLSSWLLILGAGAWAALRRRRPDEDLPAAAFVASAAATQFLSWTVPSQWIVLTAGALLVAPRVPHRSSRRGPAQAITAMAIAVSIAFLWFAWKLSVSDSLRQHSRAAFDRGDIRGAIALHREAREGAPPGRSTDLWFSRRLTAVLEAATIADEQPWTVARQAAERAADDAEERSNALYHLAQVYAREERLDDVIETLRRSADAAPTWYAPRARLAQALQLAGNEAEAREEAQAAIGLAGTKEPEVRALLPDLARD